MQTTIYRLPAGTDHVEVIYDGPTPRKRGVVYSVFVACVVRDDQQHPVVARLRSLNSALRLLDEIRACGVKAYVSTGKGDPAFFLANSQQYLARIVGDKIEWPS